MRLWLDDVRPAPDQEGWVWCKSVSAAIRLLKSAHVHVASLDHDLGQDKKTGYDLVKWMAKKDIWPDEIHVHSQNPVGRDNMLAVIKRHQERG